MSDLPPWCTLVRAPNPGPMTLEGTNSYRLRARDGTVVVDPGPLVEEHLQVAATGPVVLTLLTHGHPDHAEGVRRFHQLTGAPVRAHDPDLCVDADPLPGDEADLDVPGLALRVLPTPGHTADSVSFLVDDPGWPGVLTGDTLLGRGTTVVAHPDGRLRPYLESLIRLRDLSAKVCSGRRLLVLPGHGPLLPDLQAAASHYLEHRQQRLSQVRTAVEAGAGSVQEVLERVYADVDSRLWEAAALSVRAQLDYMAEQGLGRRQD